MSPPANSIAITLPPGDSWAVAVSGGPDSVALLRLLCDQPNLRLHVVHLNHELRGPESEADAQFVQNLAGQLSLACTIGRRTQIEPNLPNPPANDSARYRAVRLALFKSVVEDHDLGGVILAHHADDVAETVLHRLLRGSGPAGLTGIALETTVDDLRLIRPLLKVHRATLREYLAQCGQEWRTDASNETDDYFRNRLRKVLANRRDLTDALLGLAAACRDMTDWSRQSAPQLTASFLAHTLNSLPSILAHESARQWLLAAGVPPDDLTPDCIDRLLQLSADAATAPAQQFPGRVTVHRRAGKIWREIPLS